MTKKYISWRRVSTFKQNRSGLGLEAQKEIIRYFVERDNGELVADYSECYTGKELSGCKELRKAMQHAKNIGAVLVIAKSDRFRNCQEALGILDEMGEGHIEFCDLPHSDRFTLTLFWALAEREALITSIRTKQALAVKKAQGCKLGASNSIYRENYNNKSDEEKVCIAQKRGRTKTGNYIASRDVQAFIKALRATFTEATQGEPTEWTWNCINTKNGPRQRVLGMMKNFQDLDGTLFRGWNFTDLNSTKLQVKLANQISCLRRSVKAL